MKLGQALAHHPAAIISIEKERIMPQSKKEEMRSAIVRSAERLFAVHGYVGTSVLSIAKAAETTDANVYVYFPSKFSLFSTIFKTWLDEHFRVVEDASSGDNTHEIRLKSLLQTFWQFKPGSHAGIAKAFVEAAATNPTIRDLEDFQNPTQRLTSLLLTALPPEQHFALEDGSLSQFIWTVFCGLAFGAHIGSPLDPDRMSDHLTRMLFTVQIQDDHS